MNIEMVPVDRWVQAQQRELAEWVDAPLDSSDWNEWWTKNFDDYSFLKGQQISLLLEVGCGPWAKNTLTVLSVIGYDKKIFLLDPLFDQYAAQGKSVSKINATKINASLEDLNLGGCVDLIVCINVLDHVRSVGECFMKMNEHLSPNGVIIIGQDLTNEEDFIRCPEVKTDIMHPIKLDLEACERYLSCYTPIYKRILSKDEGRNPNAHYATLLFAGILGHDNVKYRSSVT